MIKKQNYKNQFILITGASQGIGKACALYLDNLGFQIFAGVRTKKDANILKKSASKNLMPVFIDITNANSIKSAVDIINKTVKGQGLMGLINNAGVNISGPMEFLPITEIKKQFDINIIGHIKVIQAFLPLLRKVKGRIINIGSIAGQMAAPFIGPYAASKFAMEAITDSLRMELRPWGISVSIIEPGSVATSMWKKTSFVADGITRHLSNEALSYYGSALESAARTREILGTKGILPEIVAKAVEHALISKKPKTRYFVGRDAKFLSIIKKFIPDRISDNVIIKQLGLPL